MPEWIGTGPHKVTVIATDEDGTDPNPPSVITIIDLVPPVIQIAGAPRRASRDRTPRFVVSASDDWAVANPGNDTFRVWLRPVNPRGPRITGPNISAGPELSIWDPECPLPSTCWDTARVVRNVPVKAGLLQKTERLRPGIYEFGAKARDTAGNWSIGETLRFRIRGTASR